MCIIVKHNLLYMAVRYYIFSLVTLIITYFFSGCKTINQDKSEAKELSLALEHKPSAFYACDVSDYYTAIVLNQCMEGLVTLDPKDLSIKPQLAERWQISSDKRTYTFTLRKGVYFHEHELFEEEEDRLLNNPRNFGKSREDNKAFMDGRYFHQLILEPEKAKELKYVYLHQHTLTPWLSQAQG